MKDKLRYALVAGVLLPMMSAAAQPAPEGKFAIKASADLGIGNALSVDKIWPEMGSKAASSDFGLDFGWTFWQRGRHSLEANVGVAYGTTPVKTDMAGEMSYHYSAPAAADMDDEPYERYCTVEKMHQKVKTERVSIPIYLNYRLRTSSVFSLHAMVGYRLSFNVASRICDGYAEVYSYGVYPQYDNLMIDADYMNEFGNQTLGAIQTYGADMTKTTSSIMAGIGAEVHISGPMSAAVMLRYEGGLNNLFKKYEGDLAGPFDPTSSVSTPFTAENAPVTYTVADGQRMRSLTDYFTRSKMSRLSCALSLIFRF